MIREITAEWKPRHAIDAALNPEILASPPEHRARLANGLSSTLDALDVIVPWMRLCVCTGERETSQVIRDHARARCKMAAEILEIGQIPGPT